jgi:hypothetical protein
MLDVSSGGLLDRVVIVDPLLCVFLGSVAYAVYGASLSFYSLRKAGVQGLRW